MAETASKTPAQKEAEADLGKRELTAAERKQREESHKDAPPVPEASPAINSIHARYNDPPGNWSDPEELIEDQPKGSVAKPPEEEAKEERKKVREEEKKATAKLREENDKRYEERRKWDEREAKRRREASS